MAPLAGRERRYKLSTYADGFIDSGLPCDDVEMLLCLFLGDFVGAMADLCAL